VTDLHERGALELGRLLARREVAPVELVEHFLARIGKDPVGAFVLTDPDRSLDEARALPARPDDAGPLWGVPIAVKDLEAVAGQRTSFGSAPFADFVPAADSAVVRRLRAAGMPMLGKTATPEFGLVCYTEPEGAAPACSPWNTEYSASGSSGGSAAAVGAGLAPLAQGGDGGGSIRTPAAACGVVGLKPSRGRVSSGTGSTDAIGLSCIGPLSRDIEDAAALLDVLCAPEPGDTDRRRSPASWLEVARQSPPTLKVGYYVTDTGGATAHPHCVAAVEAVVEELRILGHQVVPVDNPFPAAFADAFTAVWATAAATMAMPPGAAEQLRPITQMFRRVGAQTSGAQAMTALITVRELGRQAVAATAGFDLVVTPTLARPPARVGELRDDEDPAAELRALAEFTPFTPPYNASGQPAVSLPVCWSSEGLPIGVQLVGGPGDEASVLQAGLQLQRAFGWVERRPPTW
jgi:amidase